MQFALQLDLRNPVSLSEKFAWAYLFVCPHYENYHAAARSQPCPAWEAEGGANVLFLQSKTSSQVSPTPRDVTPFPERAVDFVPYKGEDDDGEGQPDLMDLIEEAETNAPADAEDVDVELPLHWMAPKTIQLGGDPIWLQSPELPSCPVCRGPMKLLAQLDAEVAESSFDDERYYLPFGCGGWGYLFVCEKECEARGAAFLWQTS